MLVLPRKALAIGASPCGKPKKTMKVPMLLEPLARNCLRAYSQPAFAGFGRYICLHIKGPESSESASCPNSCSTAGIEPARTS